MKYIKRKLYGYSATGVGFDISCLLKIPLSILFDQEWMGLFNVGINLQDVGGTKISWDTESEHNDKVLMNSKLGFSYTQPFELLDSKLLFAWDIDTVYDRIDHYGMEFEYKKNFAIRSGYYDKNFSLGAGIFLCKFNVDYAFITNPLGNTNRVGIKYSF
jgi:hypothetical protein